MKLDKRLLLASLAGTGLLSPMWAQDQDPDIREIHPPLAPPVERVLDEPASPYTVAGERIPDRFIGPGTIRTVEQMMRAEAAWDPSTQVNKRLRNGRQGTWEVPGIRGVHYAHSGIHLATNKWGDTRMGIGFNQSVDLVGVWIAGEGGQGSWAPFVVVVGYSGGVEVGRTAAFEDIDDTPSWFQIDLGGIDRIEIVAEAAQSGAGWYAIDDITFTPRASGRQVVIDFEDLEYEDTLTGSGYAGLTWETGTGDCSAGVDTIQPPQGPGGGNPGSAGADLVGGGTYAGLGTPPNFVQQFQGPKIGDPGANYIPPDTCGSVGIDHFVSVVNTNISVYTKSTGTRVMNKSLTSFFGVSGQGDPRVVFDPDSQRFFVISTNFNNRIRLAVSSTSDPTGSWFTTWFNPGQGSDAG